jgi:hypothetical protein
MSDRQRYELIVLSRKMEGDGNISGFLTEKNFKFNLFGVPHSQIWLALHSENMLETLRGLRQETDIAKHLICLENGLDAVTYYDSRRYCLLILECDFRDTLLVILENLRNGVEAGSVYYVAIEDCYRMTAMGSEDIFELYEDLQAYFKKIGFEQAREEIEDVWLKVGKRIKQIKPNFEVERAIAILKSNWKLKGDTKAEELINALEKQLL